MLRPLAIFLAATLVILPACQNRDRPEETSRTQAETRPTVDIRSVRETVPGQSMPQVLTRLGKPTRVFTVDGRESWEYRNAAWDPVTKRTVTFVEVLFRDRRVESVNFSY